MITHTLRDGTTIELTDLNPEEEAFYWQVLEKFQRKDRWVEFNHFALSMTSLAYSPRRRQMYPDRDNPLLVVLKDMSVQLGKEQGFI